MLAHMQNQFNRGVTLDGFAITLSSLCLLHCLFLPILSSALPLLSIGAEQEWIHKLLVLMAAPAAAYAAFKTLIGHRSLPIVLSLILGLSALFAGAFLAEGETAETLWTVAGAILLTIGHGLRWRAHKH